MSRKKIGELGENIAARYLTGKGYKILSTNFHSGKWGEIDIIAQKNERLFFVEVRTKSGKLFGTAEESMISRKKQRFKRAINYYLISKKINSEKYQADFIAIYLDNWNRKAQIKHYPNITL